MNVKFDVIVIGSGIAGLGCAIPLAEAGKKVLILEKRDIRGRSTEAAAGILDPLLEMEPDNPLMRLNLEALRRYPFYVRKLIRKTHKDLEFARTGMAYIAESKAQERALNQRFKWQKKLGIPIRWIPAPRFFKSNAAVTRKVRGVLFYPGIAKINPGKLRHAMISWARRLGIRFSSCSGRMSIMSVKKQIAGVSAGGKAFLSPAIVNAAGCWAGRESFLNLQVPVLPVRGQILIVKGRMNISTIIHSLDGAYIVPWGSGQYLVGSTVEFAGYNNQVTAAGIEGIKKRAARMVPAVAALKKVTTWAGLRPYSKDGRPFIGLTNIKGYYLATGYYRSGILIGPYAGGLLAKGILSGKMPLALSSFSPKRLKKGKIKFGKAP